MGDKYNKRRSSIKKKRKRIRIIIAGCIVVVAAIGIAIKFMPKQDKQQQNIQLANPGDTNLTDNSDKTQDNTEKVETPKLDNSGYLQYPEDSNADDAEVVAENTKGLLNGTKTYPVRTDGKKVVYLTFDDGPSTTNTPEVLDILDKYNVKATFFVLGTSLENDEAKELLKDIAKNGHAIANHTYGHDYKYLYPNRTMNVDNIISDIQKNENAMKEILGQDFSTRVIRFPGGYWSWEGRTAMKEAMEQYGYYNVDWNALNKDAEGAKKNADQLVECTKESVEALGPNADSVVLLMHDTYGKEETVKALPRIIEYLQSQGFEFRTIK